MHRQALFFHFLDLKFFGYIFYDYIAFLGADVVVSVVLAAFLAVVNFAREGAAELAGTGF